MGMKDRWKGNEPQEAKRKERSREKGGWLGIKEQYVSRIVEVRYWQPYRLAALKMSWPPFGLPTQKSWRLAPPLSVYRSTGAAVLWGEGAKTIHRVDGADSIGHGWARALTFINGWARASTVSRRTENKKLTILYRPSRKRSPKRLVVLVEPKSGRERPKFTNHIAGNVCFEILH